MTYGMIYVKLVSTLSKYLGYMILSTTGIVYVLKILSEPIEKVATLSLTAIAIIGALSALCFSYAPCISDENDKNSGLYSGEKFLHSTLLIIQTLFLKYVADQVLFLQLVKSVPWLETTISMIANTIIFWIGSSSVVFAALGFDSLNKTLWSHYVKNAKKNLNKE